MKNKKMFNILVISISSLLFSYYVNLFWHYGMALITTANISVMPYTLSIILVSVVGIIMIITFLKYLYIRDFKRKEQMIITIITNTLLVLSLVFFILSFKTHFKNLYYGIESLAATIGSLISYGIFIFIDVESFLILKNKTINKVIENRPLDGLSSGKYSYFLILALFAGYGLMTIPIWFLTIKNIEVYPFGYLVLLCLFMLMVFDLIYVIVLEIYNNKVFSIIGLILNGLGILLFIISEIVNFSYLPYVGKPFCPADFAGNIVLLPTLIILMIVSVFIYYFTIRKRMEKTHS